MARGERARRAVWPLASNAEFEPLGEDLSHELRSDEICAKRADLGRPKQPTHRIGGERAAESEADRARKCLC